MAFLPGQVTGQTYTPKNILVSSKGLIEGRGVINASLAYDGGNTGYEDEIRAGTPMAQITATKLWVPCKRTRVNMTGATATAITVDDARAFRTGDVITIGGDTGLTISAINYTTNVITIASTTVADNDEVFAEDGSGVCLGFLNEFVKLKDVNFDGAWRNKPFAHLVLAGEVDYAQIVGDLASIRAASGMYISQILWNDQQGQV